MISIKPFAMPACGWISVDVTRRHDRKEIAALALQSYRHFALVGMLKKLESGTRAGG